MADRIIYGPQRAREQMGLSIFSAAQASGVPRASLELLEQRGPAHCRKMQIRSVLRYFEILFPNATLRDFVGKGCPLELVPVSKVAEKRIVDAQVAALSEECRKLRAEVEVLRKLPGARAARLAAGVPDPE